MAPESVRQVERARQRRRVPTAAPRRPRSARTAGHAPPPRIEPQRSSRASVERGRRAAADEHAVVPGLRARAHAASAARRRWRGAKRREPPPGSPASAPTSRRRRRRSAASIERRAGAPRATRRRGTPRAGAACRAERRRGTRRCAGARDAPLRDAGPHERATCPAADAAQRAARPERDDERAALDEGPDRGALRRAGLHGEAAAPAGAGAPDAEAARLRLLAGPDPQARRGPAAPTSPTRRPGPPACSSATC